MNIRKWISHLFQAVHPACESSHTSSVPLPPPIIDPHTQEELMALAADHEQLRLQLLRLEAILYAAEKPERRPE